jgi:Domain of unknown function (DUF2019)
MGSVSASQTQDRPGRQGSLQKSPPILFFRHGTTSFEETEHQFPLEKTAHDEKSFHDFGKTVCWDKLIRLHASEPCFEEAATASLIMEFLELWKEKPSTSLLSRYRDAAEQTGTLDSAGKYDPKKHNKLVKTIFACYDKLRDEEDGRSGIISLMSNPDPRVRLWAATHSLQWIPNIARRVLEELRDAGGPGSFEAEMTLKEFGLGRLSF